MSEPIEGIVTAHSDAGSYEMALVSDKGMVIWGTRPDGSVFVNPEWPGSPILAVTELWRHAQLHQSSGVGGVFPELAEALDSLVDLNTGLSL